MGVMLSGEQITSGETAPGSCQTCQCIHSCIASRAAESGSLVLDAAQTGRMLEFDFSSIRRTPQNQTLGLVNDEVLTYRLAVVYSARRLRPVRGLCRRQKLMNDSSPMQSTTAIRRSVVYTYLDMGLRWSAPRNWLLTRTPCPCRSS